jgi:hypothetical protein
MISGVTWILVLLMTLSDGETQSVQATYKTEATCKAALATLSPQKNVVEWTAACIPRYTLVFPEEDL